MPLPLEPELLVQILDHTVLCQCGHDIDRHCWSGCVAHGIDMNVAVCPCKRRPSEIAVAAARTGVQIEVECDPLDDNQDHHDWTDEPLATCRRCGTLSQAWEE